MHVEIANLKLIKYDNHKYPVPEDSLKELHDKTWVKLTASRDSQLYRLIMGKGGKNVSFANSEGYMALLSLRQIAQASPGSDSPGSSLFGGQPASKKIKTVKKKIEQQDDEQVPLTITIANSSVQVLSSSHPQEALWVECDEEALTHVFEYIRNYSDDVDDRRHYSKGSGHTRMGLGRTAVKGSDGKLHYQKRSD